MQVEGEFSRICISVTPSKIDPDFILRLRDRIQSVISLAGRSVINKLFHLVLPQLTITSLFTCMAAQERLELASVHISHGPIEAQQGTAGRFNAPSVCGHIMAT